MPELPEIEAYIEALRARVLGKTLRGVRTTDPFLLRTAEPPLEVVAGGQVESITRLGKRIAIEVSGSAIAVGPPVAAGQAAASGPPVAAGPAPVAASSPGSSLGGSPLGGHAPSAGRPLSSGRAQPAEACFLVLHLMVAGRLHWKDPGARVPKPSGLAAFDFDEGTLILTEAGKKRRASLHLLRGRAALAALDPGGMEVLGSSVRDFGDALRRENHTLKRALTDPGIVSGIGNAYSDEILHRARLSPFKQTRTLGAEELARLHDAALSVLAEWTERLRAEARHAFPEKVTAFRPGMAVHGRFGAACPVCGAAVQRIVYAKNECDYCPVCQTEGRILADRSLSRLLKDDWAGYAGNRP